MTILKEQYDEIFHDLDAMLEENYIIDSQTATQILIDQLTGEKNLNPDLVARALNFLAKKNKVENHVEIDEDDITVVSKREAWHEVYKERVGAKDLKDRTKRHLSIIKKELYGDEEMDVSSLQMNLTSLLYIHSEGFQYGQNLNIQRKI
jgi:hypothetical protein